MDKYCGIILSTRNKIGVDSIMKDVQEFRRGDIWIVNIPESKGSIQNKQRPCVLVSNNVCNHYSQVLHICPLTSITTKSKLPTHTYVSKDLGLLMDSLVLCEQIMPVTKDDFIQKISVCDQETMTRISKGMAIQLGIIDIENKNNAVYA